MYLKSVVSGGKKAVAVLWIRMRMKKPDRGKASRRDEGHLGQTYIKFR